jgi:single-stranded DNA-binding protein
VLGWPFFKARIRYPINVRWAKEIKLHLTYASNRLGESFRDTFHGGDHVFVDGQLVSSNYEREDGKSKKAKAAKVTIF